MIKAVFESCIGPINNIFDLLLSARFAAHVVVYLVLLKHTDDVISVSLLLSKIITILN